MREVRVIQPNVVKILLKMFKQFFCFQTEGALIYIEPTYYYNIHSTIWLFFLFQFTGDIQETALC